jgi:hypothetical protein
MQALPLDILCRPRESRAEKNRQQIRLAVKYRILSLKNASLRQPA